MEKSKRNYLITFESKDAASDIVIRKAIEDLGPDTWVHVFKNQVAVQCDLDLSTVTNKIRQACTKHERISVFEFTHYFCNNSAVLNELSSGNY